VMTLKAHVLSVFLGWEPCQSCTALGVSRSPHG
jgi:hypothetical protein